MFWVMFFFAYISSADIWCIFQLMQTFYKASYTPIVKNLKRCILQLMMFSNQGNRW